MIRNYILPAVLLLAGCNNVHPLKKAEDPQDAGREFIRAALDGDYDRAKFYLYDDSTNETLFNMWKKRYDGIPHEERKKFQDADILPIDIHAVNDSVTSYTYANSYKRDTMTIRVVRINGDWLVDLKEILKHRR
ncbi:MAG TPA: hypothetical protein VMH27_04545 [Puia sp.]|nr:hypothetical protein [Puia sp.]